MFFEVESDEFCQRVISSRQKDGLLPPGKIYHDVQEFHPKRGEASCLTAGFPCQVSYLHSKSLSCQVSYLQSLFGACCFASVC